MKYTPMEPGQGASPQQWRTATRTGASPQQCPTGTHTHNSKSGNTGQGTQEQAPIYSTLRNAPIKPHKPRKGAGVLGIYPRHKMPHTGKGHKKSPAPCGRGYVLSISFQNLSQQHERKNQQEHKAHFLHLLTRTGNAGFPWSWYTWRRFRAYPALMPWYQFGNL